MLRNKGFTLIEMMTALAIVAIAAVLAMPMIGGLIESSRLTSTTNNMVEALTMARSEAIRRREAVAVVPAGATWSDGWLVQVVSDDSVLGRYDPVPPAITFDVPDDLESIEFQANGQRSNTEDSPAAALAFDLCGKGPNGRRIEVLISGSSKIQSALECP